MRYRQIHLDFHTAPVIDDVGTEFNVKDFVKTLKDAHVNSINIFAKCHHGMCYYSTKVGKMHPSLKFDLMGQMIDELHKNDITCPIYFPLGWEEDAADHKDWLEMGANGVPGHKLPGDTSYYSWRKLCLNNSEYKAYIKKQLKEIADNYPVDGFWFDIISQQKCICPECKKEMIEMGLDYEKERDLLIHDDFVLTKLQKELNDFVAQCGEHIATIYNSSWAPNSGLQGMEIDRRSKLQDHMEIESLPSGEWGYNHFPLFVNYHNRNNEDVIGMNGKFHISWGDHGSLKNNEALEYECFRMIANGCACSVGDQLHPKGAMNKAAYQRIGRVYSEVEKLEPYVEGSKKVADIGVVVSTDFFEKDTTADEGIMRMLMELHYTFDLIPVGEKFDKYKLIVLPDKIDVNDKLSAKLKEYIEKGGRVLATGRSTDKASLGIEYIKDSDYEPAYIGIEEGLIDGVEPLEYVFYVRGVYVKSDIPVKAYVGNPYFNRTADCFSSHRHFPFKELTEYPGICLSDSVGYCSFPIFTDYMINGNRVYRDIARYLIENLLPEPAVKVSAPTCAEVTVREKAGKEYVHIISYIPERRTKTIDVVDTKLPILNTEICIKAENGYKFAKLLREGSVIELTEDDKGYLKAVIPCIDGYECVEFS